MIDNKSSKTERSAQKKFTQTPKQYAYHDRWRYNQKY